MQLSPDGSFVAQTLSAENFPTSQVEQESISVMNTEEFPGDAGTFAVEGPYTFESLEHADAHILAYQIVVVVDETGQNVLMTMEQQNQNLPVATGLMFGQCDPGDTSGSVEAEILQKNRSTEDAIKKQLVSRNQVDGNRFIAVSRSPEDQNKGRVLGFVSVVRMRQNQIVTQSLQSATITVNPAGGNPDIAGLLGQLGAETQQNVSGLQSWDKVLEQTQNPLEKAILTKVRQVYDPSVRLT